MTCHFHRPASCTTAPCFLDSQRNQTSRVEGRRTAEIPSRVQNNDPCPNAKGLARKNVRYWKFWKRENEGEKSRPKAGKRERCPPRFTIYWLSAAAYTYAPSIHTYNIRILRHIMFGRDSTDRHAKSRREEGRMYAHIHAYLHTYTFSPGAPSRAGQNYSIQ
ncbi:hypothetical protein GGS23DRAFT_565822 [Durotheca rogersii]|uniref:uncharacterized protein n=1 Tax=Durotheca rogersii TaxID=419775 RepID=UPI002220EE59|nr:uncharacterized protein GGS23DRAFT_565822 [Durotheca rogersii]KAI5863883.1 hypothetical protein GGS23DRAFT_565822 [Durotheca rogersii]